MKNEFENKDKLETLLLDKFNNREHSAFGEVYSMYYSDFHRYTIYLYKNIDIDSEDIIHDIFLTLWEKRTIQFDNLIKIKGFIIIAIKNGYKNHIRHSQHERKYAETLYSDNDFEYDAIEFELFSTAHKVIGMLPTDCAEIFKLYLDGYKPEEIATLTGKQPQTIYNKKQEAISILRKKLTRDKLMMITTFLNFP